MVLVYESSYHRIPKDIHETDYEEHGGRDRGRKSEDIGVEYQQIHADSLIDKVLGEVSGTETDPLEP